MMVSRGPVIHIGFPKCASTFLQKVIFPKLSSFKFIECAEASHILGRKYYYNLPKDFLFFRLGQSKYIYSSEGILNYCPHWSEGLPRSYEREKSISNIIRIFRDYGDILIVIRRQDELAESLFRSSAAFYFGKPESVFLDFPIKKKGDKYKILNPIGFIFTESFDYYKWIMRIANQLGKERVHILVYEDLVHNPKRYFERLSFILEENVLHLMRYKDNRKHISPKKAVIIPSYIRPLRYFKRHMPSSLIELKRIFNKKVSFDEKNKLKLLNLFKHGNKLLSSEFDLDLDKYGYF